MPERHHISNETWKESQALFYDKKTTQRVNLARKRLAYHAGQVRENLVYGPITSLGVLAGVGALYYFDEGSDIVRQALAVFGGIMALGVAMRDREERAKKSDWEVIFESEVANSRRGVAGEDLTLSRAIYESGLKFTTQDEVINLEMVLEHLRKKGVLDDQ